jgi:hypothetical protein
MEQIVIRVKDKQKAQALANFLQTLDFVETVTGSAAGIAKKSQQAKKGDFFPLAGIWSGRETSLESIRQKAWPKRL